jgi:hypothetical protein
MSEISMISMRLHSQAYFPLNIRNMFRRSIIHIYLEKLFRIQNVLRALTWVDGY